jgi:CheY-like chemotaxis protein
VLTVSDTGCGMAEDVVDRIFDPYFTTKAEGKGTGLGLATVYSIVHSCNGDIRVKSILGGGTCFTVLLPAALGDRGMEKQNMDPGRHMAGKGEHLLVVDDDPDIALMCEEGFKSLGYQVDAFSSSREALAFFKENHGVIDIVVTDQTMPGKTGIELARSMLEIKDLPIILCSGYAGGINKKIVEKAGIKRFVMKPVTIASLSEQIQQLIKGNPSIT